MPTEVTNNTVEELGCGKRERTPSVLLKPYVTYNTHIKDPSHALPASTSKSLGKSLYALIEYICFDRLTPAHQAYLETVLATSDPVHYKDAIHDPRWNNAMGTEVGALEGQHTWDIIELPPDKVAIGCKWVYRTKFNSDGTVERYKARLVILGNHQEEGVDYKETFDLVIQMNTVRILLEISVAKGWDLHQMDVHSAFLHGDLDEEVYMKLHPGFKTTGLNQVCKLRKSLYGLQQDQRCWFTKLSTALKKFGFQQNHSDYSLFTLKRGTYVIYVLVYIDDLVIRGSDAAVISNFKAYLSRQFHMKDLGVLKYFLCIEVAHIKDGIYLSQHKYALDIIKECGLLGARPINTPMEQNHVLARDKGAFFDDPIKYRCLVGRMVYFTVTKPDLSYTVHMLAQFMQKHELKYWNAVLRVVHYLKNSPGQGILLSSKNDITISAYCDSDWEACPMTCRSLTGYICHAW